MLPDSSRPSKRNGGGQGFTLIEVVLVMAMLGIVLSIAYGILLDCIEADRRIDKLTIPEKVGEGVLSLIRNDLSGTIYRNLGTRVFLVTDGGNTPEARDEIRFVSTIEPTPQEEGDSSFASGMESLRTVTGLGYFLRPSQVQENVTCYTLFRKEVVDFGQSNPLEAPGMSFEVYDKVKSFSIECFDGWSWFPDWDSETRIRQEEEEASAALAAGEGEIGRVSKSVNPLAASTPGVDPNAASQDEVLPPAGIPVSVRVEVAIYAAVGNRFERDSSGNPIVKTYSTIVPILAAQRIPIDIEDEEVDAGGLASSEGEEGEEQGSAVPGGPGGPGRPGRKGGPGMEAFERGPRGSGGPPGMGPGGGGRGRAAGPGGGPPPAGGGAGRIAPRIGGGGGRQ